jgi:hypothetical protein
VSLWIRDPGAAAVCIARDELWSNQETAASTTTPAFQMRNPHPYLHSSSMAEWNSKGNYSTIENTVQQNNVAEW